MAYMVRFQVTTMKHNNELHLAALPSYGPLVTICTSDTHVWQIATTYYLPKLRGKVLTPKVHGAVQDAFEERFGPFAGW